MSHPHRPLTHPETPGAGTHEAGVGASARAGRGRSVGTLLRELSGEMSTLFRKESALARAELREKLDQVGSGAAEIGAGALLSFAGLLVLLDAAVIGLARVVPLWLSALIVGGAVLLIGLVVLARGRSNLRSEKLAPQRTIDSMRRDADLVRDEADRVRERMPGERDDGSETTYGATGAHDPGSH